MNICLCVDDKGIYFRLPLSMRSTSTLIASSQLISVFRAGLDKDPHDAADEFRVWDYQSKGQCG